MQTDRAHLGHREIQTLRLLGGEVEAVRQVVEKLLPTAQAREDSTRIYPARQDARADVFNYIEMIYKPRRRHSTAGDLSPIEFEKRHSQQLGSVQWIRGDSRQCLLAAF